VCCWEILARSIPYPGLDPVQAASRVCFQGLRLPIPPETPGELAKIMVDCWNAEPIKRPNFKDICLRMGDLGTD
jgi:Protein tyrosine and serine/threonine kinase